MYHLIMDALLQTYVHVFDEYVLYAMINELKYNLYIFLKHAYQLLHL